MKKKKIWICSDPAPLFPEGGSADLIPHQNEADPKHSNLGWVYPYISYLVPIYLVPCGTDLSVYLSIYQYLYLYIYRPAELIYLSVYIFINLSVSINIFIYLFIDRVAMFYISVGMDEKSPGAWEPDSKRPDQKLAIHILRFCSKISQRPSYILRFCNRNLATDILNGAPSDHRGFFHACLSVSIYLRDIYFPWDG